MYVLELNNVCKSLSNRPIVKNISLQVEEGEIFGFLGPNGAGKTTTIKMIVGLIQPNSGTIKIMGKDIQTEREEALINVGAVVENPELYLYMSGLENLRQLARINNNITQKDIDEVVEFVGLKNRIKDKVRKYSLGMKQRLGLAQALLSNPKILILDEPTNGLDPSGIIEFRNLLKKLAKERNISVFVSSHMLSEIQQLCDKVAFINNGEIQAIESINISEEDSKETINTVILSTTEREKCSLVLKKLTFIQSSTLKDNLFEIQLEKGLTPQLVFELAKNNIPVEEIYNKKQDIEDRYLEIVEGGNK
ncbi:MAG: ABC transporter ATP-binding protein [Clostridiales bacterium]|nr:ABC transporter ATP-binding protein [Clostridiales bacterium]